MKIVIIFLISMVQLNFTGAMMVKQVHQPAGPSQIYLTVNPGSIAFVQMPTDIVHRGTLHSERIYPSWLMSKSQNNNRITEERFFLYDPHNYYRLSWIANIKGCGHERNNPEVKGYTGYIKTHEGVYIADLVHVPELEIIEEITEKKPHIFIKSYLDNEIYGGELRRLEKNKIPEWISRSVSGEIPKRHKGCFPCYTFNE